MNADLLGGDIKASCHTSVIVLLDANVKLQPALRNMVVGGNLSQSFQGKLSHVTTYRELLISKKIVVCR